MYAIISNFHPEDGPWDQPEKANTIPHVTLVGFKLFKHS